jgi:hypothetical protein
MIRCIARVEPIKEHRCDKNRGNAFLFELNCEHISEEELRRERFAQQNERVIQERLRELERRRQRFCSRRKRCC